MLVLSLAATARSAEAEGPLVLTGMQATYSVTAALVAGTPIRVVNVPPDGRTLAMQKDYLSRRFETLSKQFSEAVAVVTVTNALPDDPLYRIAREANIRIVDIDAALPWSLDRPGVGLVESPRSTVKWGSDADPPTGSVAPYFWLSLSNAMRMADLVALDLGKLFPDAAATIQKNLDALKRSLLKIKGDSQQRILASSSDVVFALTPDFVYLTNDTGLLVDGYFIKQDVRWTKADLSALTEQLKRDHVKAVIHRWMPSDAIQAAVRAAGARIVVLETGDPGSPVDGKLDPQGLQAILKKNLEAIFAALD